MKTNINFSQTDGLVTKKDFEEIEPHIYSSWQSLISQSGSGAEFTGWLHLPSESINQKTILDKIEATRQRIEKMQPSFVIVIGIGGSYLGARAIYEALKKPFEQQKPEMIFAGHNIDANYHSYLIKFLENKNFVVIAISKSGTTTEPAIAFRLLRELMYKKHKSEATERIIVVTDEHKGALRTLATTEGYESYIIPDNVGGRFSVFTPVGLLPLALCGYSIKEVLEGANNCEKQLCNNKTLESNSAMKYAAIRQILYNKGKNIELISTFYPELAILSEWWKQLFGESEGKNGKGIFPASLVYSTDLHSLGQFVQDGSRTIFETFLSVEKTSSDINIPILNSDVDELQYLEGKQMSYVNKKAEIATRIAHQDGKVPILSIEMPCLNEFIIGELMYFFEFSCAISAYTMGVNPFDQPGVEAYKKKMFELLDKPKKNKKNEASSV